MDLIRVEKKVIHGFSTRTNNEAEMKQVNAKIPSLWQRFDNSVAVDYRHGERVYGVYLNYASDDTGEFDVIAGFDGSKLPEDVELTQVVIPEGQYLVFRQIGKMPDIAIAAWTAVWQYFTNPESGYERCFSTDFEVYPSGTQIEIHIAVK